MQYAKNKNNKSTPPLWQRQWYNVLVCQGRNYVTITHACGNHRLWHRTLEVQYSMLDLQSICARDVTAS